MSLYNEAHSLLKKEGLDIEDFTQLVSHLFSYGIIIREENVREEKLYDWYLRIEELVKDHFTLSGVQVVHDEDLQSVRLYAPGSETPEEFPVDFGDTKYSNVSMRLNQEETAYLIALSLMYDEKLKDKQVKDIEMTAEITLEEFNISLATYLGYHASLNRSVRDDAFRTLRRLRAISYGKDVFLDNDNPLFIRPYIKQIIPAETLKSIIEEGFENEN